MADKRSAERPSKISYPAAAQSERSTKVHQVEIVTSGQSGAAEAAENFQPEKTALQIQLRDLQPNLWRGLLGHEAGDLQGWSNRTM